MINVGETDVQMQRQSSPDLHQARGWLATSSAQRAADYDSISGWQIGNSALLAGRQTIVCCSCCCPRLAWRISPSLRTKYTQGHLPNLPTFALSSSQRWTKKKQTACLLRQICTPDFYFLFFLSVVLETLNVNSRFHGWDTQLLSKVTCQLLFWQTCNISKKHSIVFHCSTSGSPLNILGNNSIWKSIEKK